MRTFLKFSLILLLISSCTFWQNGQKETDNPGGNPGHNPGPPPTSRYGIFAIHGYGQWAPTNPIWTLPFLDGVKIMIYWSILEPSQGQYNFQPIDYHLDLCRKFGKKLIVEVVTADDRRGDYLPPSATPPWVFQAGAKWTDHQYPYAEDPTQPSQIPIYWDQLYQDFYGRLIQALASRYDGTPELARIEIGVGIYGETIISKALIHGVEGQKELWQSLGLTKEQGPDLWVNTVLSITDLFTVFKKTELALLISDSALGAVDPEIDKQALAMKYAEYAASKKIALQFCGTLPDWPYGDWPGNVLDTYRSRVPVIYEANGPSGGHGGYCDPEKTDLYQLLGTIKTMKERKARAAIFWCGDLVKATTDQCFNQTFKDLKVWLQTGQEGQTSQFGTFKNCNI